MLPAKFESVQGLKVYNRDFAQTRELTFALVCQPDDVEKLEEFAPIFAERLRATALEHARSRRFADGIAARPSHDLQGIAIPLLLNLDPEAFAATIAVLQPGKLQARLARLHQEIEAGSPRPEFELQLDPLGVITPALKPFSGNAALEQDQPLISTDGTTRIFLAVTNQPSISAFDCQALMKKVNAFRAGASEGWEGERTARSARYRALGLRRGNFAQHAARHHRHAARARSCWWAAFSTSVSVAGCRSSAWDFRSSFAVSSRSPPDFSSLASSTW